MFLVDINEAVFFSFSSSSVLGLIIYSCQFFYYLYSSCFCQLIVLQRYMQQYNEVELSALGMGMKSLSCFHLIKL